MAGVFQNIDPPPPSPPGECVPPAFGAGEGHTRWLERGGCGHNILEDVRHSSVLYVRKYFVNKFFKNQSNVFTYFGFKWLYCFVYDLNTGIILTDFLRSAREGRPLWF